jgi:hypothetical protein
MHRGCVRSIAASLVILSLSVCVSEATPAGQEDQDRETRIHQKLERLQSVVQQRQQAGINPQPVGELMQGFEPLMRQGKVKEAEALLDRALELANKLGSAAETGPPPSLQRKIHCLEAQVQKWQQAGKDPQPIGEILQDFPPLMEQQKFVEAERVADRALKVAGGTCPDQPTSPPGAVPPQVGAPTSLQRKRQCLEAQIQEWRQEGKDPQPIGEILQDFPPLMEQQKFVEAEQVVDRALKVAGGTCPDQPTSPPRPPPQASAAPAATPPVSLQEKMQRLQALFNQREQKGADLRPVGELMQDFEPLMQQEKFSEAEALVDRALKLLGEPAQAN